VRNPGRCLLTDMPVCTRLDVPLSRLATLKLPQVHQISLYLFVNTRAMIGNLISGKIMLQSMQIYQG
jgi:hypothetical protein